MKEVSCMIDTRKTAHNRSPYSAHPTEELSEAAIQFSELSFMLEELQYELAACKESQKINKLKIEINDLKKILRF